MKNQKDTELLENYKKLTNYNIEEQGDYIIIHQPNSTKKLRYSVAVKEMEKFVSYKLKQQQKSKINLVELFSEPVEPVNKKIAVNVREEMFNRVKTIAGKFKTSPAGLIRTILNDIVVNDKLPSINADTDQHKKEGHIWRPIVCSVKESEYKAYKSYAEKHNTNVNHIIKVGLMNILKDN